MSISTIRINVLTTYDSPNSLGFIYPLLINRHLLSKRGAEFRFYDSINEKFADCDSIFVNSKFFKKWHSDKEEELYGLLEGFKKTAPKVIWFDTNDSTGTTQFNIAPFVAGYYKSQLLKDRSLYEKNFYGLRIFTDYYKTLFDVNDNETEKDIENQRKSVGVLLPKEHAHKLHVSWNSAMNDWGAHIYNYTYAGLIAKLRSRFSFGAAYRAGFIRPGNGRKTNICGRIGLSHLRNTVRLQREKIAGILNAKFGVDTPTISRKKYIEELKNSRIAVSPFGLGEISCRDFEIIINGAVMFKQDMSHLETWPPLYVDEKTYVSFAWDLSDFEDKLRMLLKDEDRIIRISEEAQRIYEYYLYGDGRLEFCDKVMDILK